MLRILRDKFVRLGRDEDGVAMVVTLAVFMFMWLVCMGVYAIGTAVKTRIHLQNACDAAAYSAAVVQADTLSRIATINRAMSWTYIQMSKRQMDYIVDRWLTFTVRKVQSDVAQAKITGSMGVHYPVPDHQKYWALKPMLPMMEECHIWDDEDDDSVKIALNGLMNTPNVGPRSKSGTIKYEISNFERTWFRDSSFYRGTGSGIDVMKRQIDADKDTLKEMYSVEKMLAADMPGHVTSAVKDVLEANMIPGMTWHHKVYHSMTPYAEGGSADSYLEILSSSEEKRFLKFSNYSRANSSKPFEGGSGALQWFPLMGGVGFCRKYVQGDALKASWAWQAWKWVCTSDGCASIPLGIHYNFCLASECHDPYFDGVPAKPLVLKEEYFGNNGTITVGVAVENDNPWASVFKLLAPDRWRKGVFSAFSIGRDLPWTPQYMVCFASAKAGYKEDKRLNWTNSRYVENDRAYRVDWEDGDWNLCQSDIDAVLIPVRRAESSAKNGSWQGDVGDFLEDYVENGLLVSSNDMLAGGSKNMDRPEWIDGKGRYLPPDYYRFDKWKELPDGQSWDWVRNGVSAQWQIGNKNAPIDWGGIQKVMFH